MSEIPLAVMAFIALLHVAGWGALLVVVLPQHLSVDGTAFGVGLGITAYMLGVRHAFDADHIAAIDNTTRKLMHEGKRPVSVGFWFSCGHSTVVLALTLLLAFGSRVVAEGVVDRGSMLHGVTRVIGTVVSSGFLYAIAALNAAVLLDIWKVFRGVRAGRTDEAALEHRRGGGGMVSRVVGPVMKLVTRPWQMFLVGLLFGLGFDTATEIGLLVLTSSAAASGLHGYSWLCLPVLFAAGMSLFDTLDGSFMRAAYGWALARPGRRITYNLVVTGLSVAIALLIGTIQILGLLGTRIELQSPAWSWITGLDLERFGFVAVGLFAATWAVGIAIWRYAPPIRRRARL